jgi:hypothetical protein
MNTATRCIHTGLKQHGGYIPGVNTATWCTHTRLKPHCGYIQGVNTATRCIHTRLKQHGVHIPEVNTMKGGLACCSCSYDVSMTVTSCNGGLFDKTSTKDAGALLLLSNVVKDLFMTNKFGSLCGRHVSVTGLNSKPLSHSHRHCGPGEMWCVFAGFESVHGVHAPSASDVHC